MGAAEPVAGFGALLREARRQRHWSQLELALAAQVSTRHLSWLETGRAQPSRAMLLRLARHLDIPLRERNRWLHSAGYAPMHAGSADDAVLPEPVARLLQQVLDAHAPYPALAFDRRWNLVAANTGAQRMVALAAPHLLQAQPPNLLTLLLDPDGLQRWVEPPGHLRAHLALRLRHEARHDPGRVAAWPALARALLDAPPPPDTDDDPQTLQGFAAPLHVRLPDGRRLTLVSLLSRFDAPLDVAVSELTLETLLPADAASAELLRQW